MPLYVFSHDAAPAPEPGHVARAQRAARFRALTEQLGVSIVRTATLCGVTPVTVSRWRAGTQTVPASAVKLLSIEAERRRGE